MGLWFITSEITGGVVFNREWALSHAFEALRAVIHGLPDLLISKNPAISFYLIPFVCILFGIMLSLRISYMSEEEFLKDCKKEILDHQCRMETLETIREQQSGSFIDSFLIRPFIFKKDGKSVIFDFYLVSRQDIKANIAILAFMSFFFFLSVFGLVQMFRMGLPEYWRMLEDSKYLPVGLLVWGMKVCLFSTIPYTLWNSVLRIVFIRRIINFKANELVVGEIIFGRYRKLFSISKADLSPLTRKQKQTTVPEVDNAALIMQRRGKDVELAGHLLPEAMTAVQDVYDRYCISTYSRFYSETRTLYLK